MNKNLNPFIIKMENSIKEAMVKIKKNGTRTLLVVKNNKFLLGTLSEGDINSALIKEFNIRSSIKNLYNKKPKKITIKKIDKEKISKLFLDDQIGIVPVVDSKNILKATISWNDVFNSTSNSNNLKNIEVVIMAGGKEKD